jgi:photosystem II stability/assembly factor-like uncharacterized protein
MGTPRLAVLLLVTAAVVSIPQAQANPVVPLAFTANGPAGIATSDINGPRAGAVNSLAVKPGDPDVIWIGSVNGGVWKTTNGTSGSPTWTPLTDHQASLSIGALGLDPTDPSASTLVAGIGTTSSADGIGGPLTGVLRTTDGGDHWTPLGSDSLSGQDISAVASRGPVIVVTSQTGVWRSDDTGATWNHEGSASGIHFGRATDLVGDPSDPNVLYAALVGTAGGVFRSTDAGATWSEIADGTFGQSGGPDLASTAKKVVLAVHHDGAGSVVYAGVMDSTGDPSGVFRTLDPAAAAPAWVSLDIPAVEGAAQGRLSIAADPSSPDLFYLGGDETPGGEGQAPVYRCNASKPAGQQCLSISGEQDGAGNGTQNDTAPHPDSRRMVVDSDGNLLETDDGGIFRRTDPHSNTGDWTSLDGDLAITEGSHCAYDHVGHVAICGTQDNGTAQQSAQGAKVWDQIGPFDGGVVAVSSSGGVSSRYFSWKSLRGFVREQCDSSNICVDTNPALTLESGSRLSDTIDPTLTNGVRIAAAPSDPNHLVIASGTVYESTDGGENLKTLTGLDGTATALAFGTDDNPNSLYVGTDQGLFRHTTQFGAMSKLTGYAFGTPVDIAVDPANSKSAWVIDSNLVVHTTDGGSTWADVTADLGPGGAGAVDFHTLALIPGSPSTVLVGASDGLYATDTAQFGHWYKLGGTLPNATVVGLDYDSVDDVLLVSAMGRSTWLLADAHALTLPTPTVLTYTGEVHAGFHDVAHLAANLSDGSGNGVAGENVTFTLGTQSCSGTTGGSGQATCEVTLAQKPATTTVEVAFAGDASFAPSATSSPFTIDKEETTTIYTGPTAILKGGSGVTLQGQLLEDGTVPLEGRTLTLSLGAQSCTGATDNLGVASCTLTFVGDLGPQPLAASFAGDDFYLASSDTSKTAVVFAFPGRGAFVLGDVTVSEATMTTSVTWWADDWSVEDQLSGGPAPASFKGFASTVSLPTGTPPGSCGGPWSSSPGDSPPPTADVPSYMGVVVAGAVSKSGSSIAGSAVHIVVVKTAGGYAPNPGAHGTGTIVATYC